jgi:hypothetical protein
MSFFLSLPLCPSVERGRENDTYRGAPAAGAGTAGAGTTGAGAGALLQEMIVNIANLQRQTCI